MASLQHTSWLTHTARWLHAHATNDLGAAHQCSSSAEGRERNGKGYSGEECKLSTDGTGPKE